MEFDQGLHPSVIGESELLARAFEFARAAHQGAGGRSRTPIAHPIAVAEMIAEAGFDQEVVAAALLHDVVEHTDRESAEISAAFPDAVATLVATLTDDRTIDDYEARKAEHRLRVIEAGRLPASIYLADKLASVRRYAAEQTPVAAARLQHYRETVELFGERDPQLPFLEELRFELPRLNAGPEPEV